MDDAFAPSSAVPAEFDVRGRATSANTLGMIAVVLAMLGACSGYMTFFFALPLGMVAIHYGRTVLAESPDEVSEVYARNGMSMGVVAAVYSTMWLFFIFMIVLLYGAMFAAIILGNL